MEFGGKVKLKSKGIKKRAMKSSQGISKKVPKGKVFDMILALLF